MRGDSGTSIKRYSLYWLKIFGGSCIQLLKGKEEKKFLLLMGGEKFPILKHLLLCGESVALPKATWSRNISATLFQLPFIAPICTSLKFKAVFRQGRPELKTLKKETHHCLAHESNKWFIIHDNPLHLQYTGKLVNLKK